MDAEVVLFDIIRIIQYTLNQTEIICFNSLIRKEVKINELKQKITFLENDIVRKDNDIKRLKTTLKHTHRTLRKFIKIPDGYPPNFPISYRI
jgi:hypothetical protein